MSKISDWLVVWFTVPIVSSFLFQAFPLTLGFGPWFHPFLVRDLLFLFPALFYSFLMLLSLVLETVFFLLTGIPVGILEVDKAVDIVVGTTIFLYRILDQNLDRVLYLVVFRSQTIYRIQVPGSYILGQYSLRNSLQLFLSWILDPKVLFYLLLAIFLFHLFFVLMHIIIY
jgi:hypothetical protein